MAKLTGTRVIQPIVPNDSNDTYPTHTDNYGKGGYRSVDTKQERDSIPVDRQKLGMAVYVVSDGNIYILNSHSRNLSDNNWSLLKVGGDTLIVVSPTAPPFPVQGLLWLNTLNGKVHIYNNEMWEIMVYKSTLSSVEGDLILNGGTF